MMISAAELNAQQLPIKLWDLLGKIIEVKLSFVI